MKSCSCTFVVFTRPGRLSLMDLCKLQNSFCFPSPAEFHLVDRLKSILKAYYYSYALAFSWDVCRIVFVTKTKHWRNFSWKRRYKKIKKILQKCNQPILCEKCKMLLMDRMTTVYILHNGRVRYSVLIGVYYFFSIPRYRWTFDINWGNVRHFYSRT